MVKKFIKIFLSSLGLILVFIFTIMAWTKFKSLGDEHREQPLAIRYEGFYHDMNHRDIGQSINNCLDDNIFNLHLSHKTNKNFSYEPNLETRIALMQCAEVFILPANWC